MLFMITLWRIKLKAPVSRLKKKEIIWLSRHNCKHGHDYLQHYNCYLAENPEGIRLGFFDIETTNLKADFGLMLCYCIKKAGKNKIYHRTITKAELQKENCLDKEVVQQCIKDLGKFDRVVTHYGKRFDIPFLRSRALFWNLDFPIYGEIFHDDTYYMCRYKLCISRNRLESACRHVLGKTRKTHINPRHWISALQGNEEALGYILEHCKRDVRDLEDLYYKLVDYTRKADVSI